MTNTDNPSPPRTAAATAAAQTAAARKRVLRHLADWDTMPADTFDDAEIGVAIAARAADVAARAGIEISTRRVR